MKSMELGTLSTFDSSKFIAELRRLDDALVEDTSVTLCGSASVRLRGIDSREATVIDLCALPDPVVICLMDTLWD